MDNQNQYGKSKFVTASMLLGILSAVLLTVSLFVPAIDLSAYHAQVQIRYSIMKICENVGLISDMWRGIPIVILCQDTAPQGNTLYDCCVYDYHSACRYGKCNGMDL